MACEGITDIVVRETGRFLPRNIYQRVFGTSPWMDLTGRTRGVYPMGLSETINVLTYERTAPYTAEPTWTELAVVDGQEGGTCLPPVTEIKVGSTTRNFRPATRAIHGPQFCAEDFRSVFDLEMQLDRIADILANYVTIEWEIRDRHEYFRMTKTKVSATDCFNPAEVSSGETAYPASCPTVPISFSILSKYRMRLLRDGANKSAIMRSNGAPLLTVIASGEAIGNLIRQNSDIRQDIRWADSGKGSAARLLQEYGVYHDYGGFIFVEDLYPRRFTCSAGTFTEVPAFVELNATKGTKAEINPSWQSAPYEETHIWDQDVFHQLIPTPIVAPHPKFRFDPVQYTGEWKILNIPDKVCNPDGNQLNHRAVLKAASMPVHPERGVSIVHQRCDPLGCVTTCT